jgi:hypothetical protein
MVSHVDAILSDMVRDLSVAFQNEVLHSVAYRLTGSRLLFLPGFADEQLPPAISAGTIAALNKEDGRPCGRLVS